MGLISLAFIPLLSIHKIHYVLQLKEIGRVGLNNAAFLLYVRRMEFVFWREYSSAGGANISLSYSAFWGGGLIKSADVPYFPLPPPLDSRASEDIYWRMRVGVFH